MLIKQEGQDKVTESTVNTSSKTELQLPEQSYEEQEDDVKKRVLVTQT